MELTTSSQELLESAIISFLEIYYMKMRYL